MILATASLRHLDFERGVATDPALLVQIGKESPQHQHVRPDRRRRQQHQTFLAKLDDVLRPNQMDLLLPAETVGQGVDRRPQLLAIVLRALGVLAQERIGRIAQEPTDLAVHA